MTQIHKDTLDMVQELISRKLGFYFDENRTESLEVVLLKRMALRQYDDVARYGRFLATLSDDSENEIQQIIEEITINETSFFRQDSQFLALEKLVLSRMLKQKGGPGDISVWSAGCSSGEEPYTIAITLHRNGWTNAAAAQILATDVDNRILAKAREGVYGAKSVRAVGQDILNAYFEKSGGDRFRLMEEPRSLVEFNYHNLVSDTYPTPRNGSWDIIFCRNTLIYFDRSTLDKVIKKLYEALSDNGYLFLGYSEILVNISDDFDVEYFNDTFFYRKIRKKKSIPPPPPKEEPDRNPTLKIRPYKELKKEAREASRAIEIPLYKAKRLFELGDYDEAMLTLEEYYGDDLQDDLPANILFARICIEKGSHQEAYYRIRETLKKYPHNPVANYLAGLALSRLSRPGRAIEHLDKAITFKNDFIMAYFTLASIYGGEGKKQKARAHYKRAAALLQHLPAKKTVELSDGFAAGTLLEICRNKLAEIGR
ncbi:MAG: CheR family methyltransferase [Pseudomonadota bacterium]